MSTKLTFADREKLLDILRELSEDKTEAKLLLKRSGEWARSLRPQFGFELAMVRNMTQLCNYLRLHQNLEDVESIARGAIQFVIAEKVEQNEPPADKISEASRFHELGKAFIASYAVHEIAVRLGETVAYHPPSITKEEQTRAEDNFLRLSTIDGCDEGLLKNIDEKIESIKYLADCGFLKRMVTNAHTLTNVLTDSKRSDDERECARGALRYFVEEDDAINDDLGLVGFLDDVFILQTAVDLVSPSREPLIELIDEVVGVWPFLNMLSLDDGSGPRPVSEFSILNASLSCPDLRSQQSANTILIAPETGPIAILVGFIKTLGLAHIAGQRQLTEKSFRPGQKVLVDYEAIAEFDGFETLGDGRRVFRLRKYRTEKGVERLGTITSWPISDLHRLVPAEGERKIRGEITRGKRNEITDLSGLSFLFNGPNKADVHAIKKKVIVVMATTLAAEFCKSTLLYGQPIKDVLPIGQISADGEKTEQWSTRFGTQAPVLLFASDLDIACSYAQEHRDDIELVVVDVVGRNREKHASIKRLNRLKIPCLMIATERIANETEVDQHNDLSVWEWGAEDLNALVWPERQLPSDAGEIAKFEHRVRATSSARPIVEQISFPIVGETYRAFCALRQLAKRRGADGLPELDEIVAQAFFATTQLMRCSTQLSDDSQCVADVNGRVSKVASSIEASNFLSDDERSAAGQVIDHIGEFLSQLKEDNPKTEALMRILSQYPAADVLCPDARLIAELENAFSGKQNRVLASAASDESFANGLVVTGWFKQSRMASILSPPIADPVVLLLYDVERRWHRQFSEQRRKMREERTKLKGREAIFPAMSGWKKPRPPVESNEFDDQEVDEIEKVRADIDEGFRQRIYDHVGAGHSDADTKARLLLFAGGVYGLFTDNYKLNVVTHLLDDSIDNDDEKASVKLLAAKDVAVGDKIVFRPKSRDLIREVADELLEPGQRDLSGLWQTALRAFINEHSLTYEAVCSMLQAAGCKAQAQAICNWINDDDMIAPQQYRIDVPAIATVTGDQKLARNIDAVIKAIKNVRSAHQQRAPRVIAKRIREKAAVVVRQEQADEPIVQLDGDLVLVRVAETASRLIPVKYTTANRLIEGDSWHE